MPGPPNIAAHCPLTGWLTAIDAALMAPVESARPMLTTQRPTSTSAALAFAVRVQVVSPVVVTLTVEVSDSPGRVDSISNPVPSTRVTLPKAPMAPRRGA